VDAIGAFWEAQFKGADAKLALSQQVVVWKDNVHAYVVSGAYHVVGTTAKGDPVDVSGKYSNIMLKVDGAWKISESALTD
jgi:ketosteroid isomerase-like protein